MHLVISWIVESLSLLYNLDSEECEDHIVT